MWLAGHEILSPTSVITPASPDVPWWQDTDTCNYGNDGLGMRSITEETEVDRGRRLQTVLGVGLPTGRRRRDEQQAALKSLEADSAVKLGTGEVRQRVRKDGGASLIAPHLRTAQEQWQVLQLQLEDYRAAILGTMNDTAGAGAQLCKELVPLKQLQVFEAFLPKFSQFLTEALQHAVEQAAREMECMKIVSTEAIGAFRTELLSDVRTLFGAEKNLSFASASERRNTRPLIAHNLNATALGRRMAAAVNDSVDRAMVDALASCTDAVARIDALLDPGSLETLYRTLAAKEGGRVSEEGGDETVDEGLSNGLEGLISGVEDGVVRVSYFPFTQENTKGVLEELRLYRQRLTETMIQTAYKLARACEWLEGMPQYLPKLRAFRDVSSLFTISQPLAAYKARKTPLWVEGAGDTAAGGVDVSDLTIAQYEALQQRRKEWTPAETRRQQLAVVVSHFLEYSFVSSVQGLMGFNTGKETVEAAEENYREFLALMCRVAAVKELKLENFKCNPLVVQLSNLSEKDRVVEKK